MKILFVCRQNVFRSQIAEAFLNHLSEKHKAKSCGTNPNKEDIGKTISDKHPMVIDSVSKHHFLKEALKHSKTKKITKKLITESDIVVLMGTNVEPPKSMKEAKRVILWTFSDPKGKDLIYHRELTEKIKDRVADFLRQLEKEDWDEVEKRLRFRKLR